MKSLYLTYDGLTDPLGQSQVLPYVIGLSKNKVNFKIISFDKPANYSNQKAVVSKLIEPYNIQWISLRYTKKPPFLSTLYDITKFKRAVKKEIIENNISLIHCRSYISALVGLLAKKKYGIPFIFDMRGFWADERIDGKIWDLSKPHHKKAYTYFKKKEKEFLQEAAYTISLTHCGKEEIASWKLPKQSPIQVIPCCTDEDLFNLKKIENKRTRLGFEKDDFVLSYLGSIGTWYMLDEMLDFFKVLAYKKENAKFLFITKDDEVYIKQKALQKGIDANSIVVKPANRSEVPSFIKASDVSIFFIKQAYSKKASSPTKMGEIMNLGVPIICNSEVGDVEMIMNKVMPELLVKSFDEKEYEKVIDALSQPIDTQKIIATSLDYYSLKNGVEKYNQIYQQVINKD